MRQCAKKRGVSIELLLLAEETPYSRPWLLSSLAQIFKRDVRIYDAYKVMHKSDQTNHQDKSFKIDDHFLSTENGKWSIIPCFRYGQGFGLFPKDSIFNIPNTLYGLGFYGLAAVLGMINNHACTGVLSVLALLSDICSIYLAFILYMYRIICVVCVTTYIINAAITYFAIKKFRKLSCDDVCKKKK